MTQYINDRRFSTIQRTDWNGELPEIISFTDFLRWNYTVDYGRYIRNLHSNNMLPLRLGIPAEAEIKTIIIEDGRYDRIDHDSFFMYVICNVLFINNGYSYQQKYVVHGYYRSGGSDFLMDIELYNGEYIHLDHPMDEFLVPILSKKDFENIADEIVEQYYPYKANYPCMINALAIPKAMGLKVDYARLSNDGKVRSKIILDNRITTVYDDKKQEMQMPVYVPTILIDESLKETDEEQNAIIHECVHAYLHNLFYELQSYYRKIVGRRMPEFDDYFSSKSQQICLKWMETQACSIPRFIQMPADQTTDFILNFLDGIAGEPKWSDYRELIDLVKSKFGVARNTAKKRIIELGWLDVRGVYMYNGRGYVEDYDVDWDFPDNYTYTLSLRHISEAYSNSDTFAELIRTQRFIYTDGHVVLNTDKYVKKENGSVIGLTEYARHHMADCCIDFKKIYAEFDYSYTYGELHKDALTPINDDNRILTDEQRKKIRLALYELSDESRLTEGAYCDEHKPLHSDRPSATKRGYGSKWQRVSKAYLRKYPLCVKCLTQGKYVTATVVDHIVPHRGDHYLMWSDTNWQALCKACHDKKTRTEDSRPVYEYKVNPLIKAGFVLIIVYICEKTEKFVI